MLQQLYSKMTEENYCKICCLDHCYPLSKTNLSNENGMYKSTMWINLRPMCFTEKISKGSKFDNHLYLLQEIEAKYFLKLNVEEG